MAACAHLARQSGRCTLESLWLIHNECVRSGSGFTDLQLQSWISCSCAAWAGSCSLQDGDLWLIYKGTKQQSATAAAWSQTHLGCRNHSLPVSSSGALWNLCSYSVTHLRVMNHCPSEFWLHMCHRTSTQSKICSSLAMSSSSSFSSCWLSSSGDKIFLGRASSELELSDRVNCSFCFCGEERTLIWGGDLPGDGEQLGRRTMEVVKQFDDVGLEWRALLPTCCEMKSWIFSPSARMSVQLRPDSLHREPTVLWLCGDKTMSHLSPVEPLQMCFLFKDSQDRTSKLLLSVWLIS